MSLRDEFSPRDLSNIQQRKAIQVREGFSVLLSEVERQVPEGRERSLVKTKLEEACMWAVRGISVGES